MWNSQPDAESTLTTLLRGGILLLLTPWMHCSQVVSPDAGSSQVVPIASKDKLLQFRVAINDHAAPVEQRVAAAARALESEVLHPGPVTRGLEGSGTALW